MAKKESSFGNMVFVLTAITFIAGLSLAAVYTITKEPIAQSKIKKKENAIKLVLPAFDRIMAIAVKPADGNDSLEFNIALKGQDTIGVAVVTYTDKGFGGRIKTMVGILNSGQIYDVVHLEMNETPGLGDKIDKKKSGWSNQFKQLTKEAFPLSVKKDGGKVDAITAATITSRAYCDAINRAYSTYTNWKK